MIVDATTAIISTRGIKAFGSINPKYNELMIDREANRAAI
jgi:hypothetical protein